MLKALGDNQMFLLLALRGSRWHWPPQALPGCTDFLLAHWNVNSFSWPASGHWPQSLTDGTFCRLAAGDSAYHPSFLRTAHCGGHQWPFRHITISGQWILSPHLLRHHCWLAWVERDAATSGAADAGARVEQQCRDTGSLAPADQVGAAMLRYSSLCAWRYGTLGWASMLPHRRCWRTTRPWVGQQYITAALLAPDGLRAIHMLHYGAAGTTDPGLGDNAALHGAVG
jgi:hypothetical protein